MALTICRFIDGPRQVTTPGRPLSPIRGQPSAQPRHCHRPPPPSAYFSSFVFTIAIVGHGTESSLSIRRTSHMTHHPRWNSDACGASLEALAGDGGRGKDEILDTRGVVFP